MAALSAHDLFYLYRSAGSDIAALRGLSLQIDDGEVVAALGPSGSGKTTLLTLAAGFMRPSSGELTVLGERFDRVSRRQAAALRRHQIGMVRQHYHQALPHELTVEEIVAMPTLLLGQRGRARRNRVAALLERAGLAHRAHAHPSELSGGEQQRVALCAALAKRPRLVLADEPTGELDSEARDSVIDLLLELSAETGAAVLIVTHDTHVAERADRTIHVRDGRLAAEGTDSPVLIIDRDGWVRLPGRLREQANLGDRVRASASFGRIDLLAQPTVFEPRPSTESYPPTTVQLAQNRIRGASVVLERVIKRYGEPHLRPVVDLSWTAQASRFHVIAGPSGSGKTTLLNLIAGLDRPDHGTVRVDGTSVEQLDADGSARFREQTVGYLSQHSTLVDYMSAAENVELALTLRRVEPTEAASIARRWLAWVGLGKLADRRADHLSGGEQRRVALARALAASPRLLLADEPTAQLDQLSGRNVIHLLESAARGQGTTVIAASHDRDVITAADAVLDLDPDVPRARRNTTSQRADRIRDLDSNEQGGKRSGNRFAVAAVLATLVIAGAALAVTHPWSERRSSNDITLERLRAAIAAPTQKQVLYQQVTISTRGRGPSAPALPTARVRSWTQGGAGVRNFRAIISMPHSSTSADVTGRPGGALEIGGTFDTRTVSTFYEYRGHNSLLVSDFLQPPIPSQSFDQLGIIRTALGGSGANTATFADNGATIRIKLTITGSLGQTGDVTYVADAKTYRPIQVEIPFPLLAGYADKALGFGGFAALLTPQRELAVNPHPASPTFVYRYQKLIYRPATQLGLGLANIRAQHPGASFSIT